MGYRFKLIGADAGALFQSLAGWFFSRGNAGCFVGAKQQRLGESFGFWSGN